MFQIGNDHLQLWAFFPFLLLHYFLSFTFTPLSLSFVWNPPTSTCKRGGKAPLPCSKTYFRHQHCSTHHCGASSGWLWVSRSYQNNPLHGRYPIDIFGLALNCACLSLWLSRVNLWVHNTSKGDFFSLEWWVTHVLECTTVCTDIWYLTNSCSGFGLRLVAHRGRSCFDSSRPSSYYVHPLSSPYGQKLTFLEWALCNPTLPRAAPTWSDSWLTVLQGCPRR